MVWDLFGGHLRYIDGGRVQMRALTELLDGIKPRRSTRGVST
jgi:hypothetical protein